MLLGESDGHPAVASLPAAQAASRGYGRYRRRLVGEARHLRVGVAGARTAAAAARRRRPGGRPAAGERLAAALGRRFASRTGGGRFVQDGGGRGLVRWPHEEDSRLRRGGGLPRRTGTGARPAGVPAAVPRRRGRAGAGRGRRLPERGRRVRARARAGLPGGRQPAGRGGDGAADHGPGRRVGRAAGPRRGRLAGRPSPRPRAARRSSCRRCPRGRTRPWWVPAEGIRPR